MALAAFLALGKLVYLIVLQKNSAMAFLFVFIAW